MSEKPPVEHQFKVKITPDVELALYDQKEALGFHSENALAAVYLKVFAGVPPAKVWEAMAKVRTYHRLAPKKGAR
jgi:UDP-N-acetylmuramyl pentapeptide synthase